jgi:endonuclease III
MAVGVVVNQSYVNENMIVIAKEVIALFQKQAQLQEWNATTPQSALETMGFDANEAFLIKTVLDRLQQAHVWLDGGALPPDTHDTMSDLSKFVGMGVGS